VIIVQRQMSNHGENNLHFNDKVIMFTLFLDQHA